MFPAYGIEPSTTLPRSIRVLPTSGANTHAATASDPNPARVHVNRRRTDARAGTAAAGSVPAGNRHHRHVTGARMELHVCVDVVEDANIFCGERRVRRAV